MDDGKFFGCLSLSAFAALSAIVGAIVGGWALAVMWGWFIVPLFDAPTLTIPYAIGITMIASLLIPEQKTDKDRDATEIIAAIIGKGIFGPVIAVVIGWIVYQFV